MCLYYTQMAAFAIVFCLNVFVVTVFLRFTRVVGERKNVVSGRSGDGCVLDIVGGTFVAEMKELNQNICIYLIVLLCSAHFSFPFMKVSSSEI